MRTIRNEISEMVTAGNIIRRRGISVARAFWFGNSKLPKICFFNSRFVKEYLQGFSLSINLAVRLQRFSIVLPFVLFEAIPFFFRLASNAFRDIGSVGRIEKKYLQKNSQKVLE